MLAMMGLYCYLLGLILAIFGVNPPNKRFHDVVVLTSQFRVTSAESIIHEAPLPTLL